MRWVLKCNIFTASLLVLFLITRLGIHALPRMTSKMRFRMMAVLAGIAFSSILVAEHSLLRSIHEKLFVQIPDCINCYKEFDYSAFWQDTMQVAQKSLELETKETPSKCPKVYVYNLPWDSIDSKRHPSRFGNPALLKGKDTMFQDFLRKTNQYALPSILEHRLKESKLCRTLDPQQADLFYAPVLSEPKGNGEWNATCQKISGEIVRDELRHLNSTNACRHFFAIGKGHTDVTSCDGWFSNPIRELKPFLRLAYSNYSFVVDSEGAHHYDIHDTTNLTYPHLFSVPYPSSLHFRSNKKVPHFPSTVRRRKALMSFIGKDNHGDTRVRQRIHKLCNDYNDSKVCDYKVKFDLVKHPTAKSRAVFCLEPAGDTPTRKSIADSIAFGCIPVLFSDLTDDVAPWHWLDWKDRARVLVPRNEFVAGRIDLKKLLQSIPKDLLKLMQNTLKEKARRFQYSLDDDQEDGVRVILDNLHREALDMERKGTCGY